MKSTLAAALTMNIAMADFQDDLQHMEGQLAPDLEMAINAHPHDGVTLLKSMGVEDRAWLTIVEQHHERIDAGGYPGKLGAADIVPGAKLVGLADRFCAKVAGRAYRKPLSAAVTIDDMANNKTSEDLTFLSLLLEVLGNYPPGILVELANGDVAVVIQKGQDRNHPMVRTLIDKSGVVRNPELKDTGQSQYAIVKAMSPEIVNQYAMSDKIKALWGYGDLE
jgi:HD-GYP domain-containing protein (c-di-GMP phosphodiesterase class II)